jgi:hypothetical protein
MGKENNQHVTDFIHKKNSAAVSKSRDEKVLQDSVGKDFNIETKNFSDNASACIVLRPRENVLDYH